MIFIQQYRGRALCIRYCTSTRTRILRRSIAAGLGVRCGMFGLKNVKLKYEHAHDIDIQQCVPCK